MRSSYIVAEENKRGVHTVDAGKSELILHQRYLNNAEGLQAEYPKTAEIYFTLSEDYKREASMKESVQKMSGRKKYKGERYSFFRDKKLGHGGNGAVYDVELEEKDDLGFPVVAKFFEYSGDDKEKRYNSVNCNRK